MIQIIPAIDLLAGKCVRLSQGDFARQKVYSNDPLSVAKQFEDAGLTRLHVVDLDGARNGKITNLRILETIARETKLLINFGGGVRTDDDLKNIFTAGAHVVTVGSVAVQNPEKFACWLNAYGRDKILLAADVRGGKLATNGWQTNTEVGIISFLTANFSNGLSQAFVTDIAKDGLMQGPSTALYKVIHRTLPRLQLTASGGVSSMKDVLELGSAGCWGVIIGKAIYEGTITLEELRDYVG